MAIDKKIKLGIYILIELFASCNSNVELKKTEMKRIEKFNRFYFFDFQKLEPFDSANIVDKYPFVEVVNSDSFIKLDFKLDTFKSYQISINRRNAESSVFYRDTIRFFDEWSELNRMANKFVFLNKERRSERDLEVISNMLSIANDSIYFIATDPFSKYDDYIDILKDCDNKELNKISYGFIISMDSKNELLLEKLTSPLYKRRYKLMKSYTFFVSWLYFFIDAYGIEWPKRMEEARIIEIEKK